jgi:hypothetical protein
MLDEKNDIVVHIETPDKETGEIKKQSVKVKINPVIKTREPKKRNTN